MWLCWFDDSTTDQRLLVTLAARCPRPSIGHSWIDAVPWSQLRSSVERLSATPPRWLHRNYTVSAIPTDSCSQQLMIVSNANVPIYDVAPAVQSSHDPGHQSSTSLDLNQLSRSLNGTPSVMSSLNRPSIQCKPHCHLSDSTGTIVPTTH